VLVERAPRQPEALRDQAQQCERELARLAHVLLASLPVL
jgi:hypothetical protein